MTGLTSTDFGDVIATQMRAQHREIAERWFERLVARLPVDAVAIFPSDQLLDHIPALIADLAEYLRAPEDEAIGANAAVVAKATELGQLRYGQRASVHQLLREYQLLGGILSAFVQQETARLGLSPAPLEAMAVLTRLHDGVGVLQQTTVDTFVGAYTDTIAVQTDRLHSFNRLVSHELRQPLTALQAALAVMKIRSAPSASPNQVVAVLERNVSRLVELTQQLERVSRLREGDDNPQVQTVDIALIASDVARQLREMADARGVAVRVAPELGVVHVDVARLELVLMNLVSNAVKYADPAKPERFVEVRRVDAPLTTSAIEIADNGVGIDAAYQALIFRRFFRVQDAESAASGVGLGLSIVQECVDMLRGSISVRSVPSEGTVFTLQLPRAL